MKRYGYTFLSTGGEYSSAINIRFFAFVAAFICGVIVYAVDQEGILSFLPLAITYFILGIGLEFFPKSFSAIVYLLAFSTSALITWQLFATLGDCIKYCYELREWHSRRGIVPVHNTIDRAFIFSALVIGYNTLMAFFTYLSNRKRVLNAAV